MAAPSKLSPIVGDLAAGTAKRENLWVISDFETSTSCNQTTTAFSAKWRMLAYDSEDFHRLQKVQRQWYLEKYGFTGEADLAEFLASCEYIIDAGAGNAMKSAWFAELSPKTIVIAADITDAIEAAAEHYEDRNNMIFVRCDIAKMPYFKDGAFDYVNCDEVIHHTEAPEKTFAELVRLTRPGGQIACYVYRRKALPRELLDKYFRQHVANFTESELKALAGQLTELGRRLSAIDGVLDVPSIPALGIEGGKTSVQRFIYWNFLKCYWNPDVGAGNSNLVNFDWYSPAQAARYDEDEFRAWIEKHSLAVRHFHKEPACYCGRFENHAL